MTLDEEMNRVPPVVSQIAEAMLVGTVPDFVKQNHSMTLEAIRNFCDKTLVEYKKNMNIKKNRR